MAHLTVHEYEQMREDAMRLRRLMIDLQVRALEKSPGHDDHECMIGMVMSIEMWQEMVVEPVVRIAALLE